VSVEEWIYSIKPCIEPLIPRRPVDDIDMIQTLETLYYGINRIDLNTKPNSREDRHEELPTENSRIRLMASRRSGDSPMCLDRPFPDEPR
jgi:hypothetical protein